MCGGPCAACKHLEQECSEDCVFAPYFPADEAEKFAIVHRIYDVSYIGETLSQLSESQRAEAVNALVFGAKAWVQDPIYGSCGLVSSLQRQIKLLRRELFVVQKSQLIMRRSHQRQQQMREYQQLREQLVEQHMLKVEQLGEELREQALEVEQLREQWRKQQEEEEFLDNTVEINEQPQEQQINLHQLQLQLQLQDHTTDLCPQLQPEGTTAAIQSKLH